MSRRVAVVIDRKGERAPARPGGGTSGGVSGAIVLGVVFALGGCRATTGRPPFDPLPEADFAEIGFGLSDKVETVIQVTDTVVAYLRADSIPIAQVKPFDGYLETEWLDAETLKPTTRRPLGDQVVKVRGFVDPATPGYARIELETVYVPFADPSRPDRELEISVPIGHRVSLRGAAALKKLKERYGVPEPPKPGEDRPPPLRPDSAAGPPTPTPVPAPAPAPVPAPPPPPPPPPPAAPVERSPSPTIS